MKKIWQLILVFLLSFFLVGCKGKDLNPLLECLNDDYGSFTMEITESILVFTAQTKIEKEENKFKVFLQYYNLTDFSHNEMEIYLEKVAGGYFIYNSTDQGWQKEFITALPYLDIESQINLLSGLTKKDFKSKDGKYIAKSSSLEKAGSSASKITIEVLKERTIFNVIYTTSSLDINIKYSKLNQTNVQLPEATINNN